MGDAEITDHTCIRVISEHKVRDVPDAPALIQILIPVHRMGGDIRAQQFMFLPELPVQIRFFFMEPVGLLLKSFCFCHSLFRLHDPPFEFFPILCVRVLKLVRQIFNQLFLGLLLLQRGRQFREHEDQIRTGPRPDGIKRPCRNQFFCRPGPAFRPVKEIR